GRAPVFHDASGRAGEVGADVGRQGSGAEQGRWERRVPARAHAAGSASDAGRASAAWTGAVDPRDADAERPAARLAGAVFLPADPATDRPLGPARGGRRGRGDRGEAAVGPSEGGAGAGARRSDVPGADGCGAGTDRRGDGTPAARTRAVERRRMVAPRASLG